MLYVQETLKAERNSFIFFKIKIIVLSSFSQTNYFFRIKGEVKSLWSKYVGLHMRYKGKNKILKQLELK